jgi:hypothetical protein
MATVHISNFALNFKIKQYNSLTNVRDKEIMSLATMHQTTPPFSMREISSPVIFLPLVSENGNGNGLP